MKKNELKQKLTLNKETVSNLEAGEMKLIKGQIEDQTEKKTFWLIFCLSQQVTCLPCH